MAKFALYCPHSVKRLKRFRLYHALCWSSENDVTVQLIRDDPECQIVFATIAFGQGFNIKSILDVYQPEFPSTVDQAKQNDGRAGRDPQTQARSVIFVPPKAFATAKKVIDGKIPLYCI
jgi:superfamily II DNA helicase RecQ